MNQHLDAGRRQPEDTMDVHPAVGELVAAVDALVDEHLTGDEVEARLERVLRDATRSPPGQRQPVRELAAAFSVAGVRVLSKSQRRRYREEFRIELVKLPRRERLGYAMRVLTSAWESRRALGEPARRAERRVPRFARAHLLRPARSTLKSMNCGDAPN